MRTEARNRAHHWLRLLGAAGLTVLFAAMLRANNTASVSGSLRLFTGAHTLLLMAIFLVGPALTSDAIGRERREGTLGLLFGTPLSARAILVGKSFVHLIRLLILWLAAFPIVMIPVLLGGVTWLDIVSAWSFEACAIFWALGAGLLATSVVRHPVLALLAAEIFSLALLIVFCGILGGALVLQAYPVITGPFGINYYGLVDFPFALLTGLLEDGGWSGTLRTSMPIGAGLWMGILAEMLLLSLLSFLFLLVLAAWRTSHLWQDSPLSARQSRRQRFWLVPRFYLGWFAARRRRWLDRNPLGWIHQHSTWGRMQSLGWCGIILLVESLVMLSPRPWEFQHQVQTLLAVGLSAHMTLAAVTVFRNDQDSGVLELLLVTPMTAGEILRRQLSAFLRRFMQPILLLIALAQVMIWRDLSNFCPFKFGQFLLLNLLTIPLIGFYAAAEFRGFTSAFFFAAFFSLCLPLIGPELSPGLLERVRGLEIWWLSRWPAPPNDSATLDFGIKSAQILAALILGVCARQGLAHRTFFFRRPA